MAPSAHGQKHRNGGPVAVLDDPAARRDNGQAPTGWPRFLARLNRPYEDLPGAAPSDPLATAAHWVSLVAAFAFWAWQDRRLWFFGDEWDFLVRRGLSYAPANYRSIWFPHNEHWSTLPILLWRSLYNVFHLSSYWPYLVPLLLAQVGVMHLAWRLCRRAGVDGWVATATVALLGFLGAGAEDLTSAFQIGFVGSVLFGYVAFDLLDLPAGEAGAPRWRDILASVALLASLMCSTIGDAMVVGAAVLLFARRPPKRALAVLALPLGSYVIWFAAVGRLGLTSRADHFSLTTVTSLPGYVWFGLSSALGQTFNLEAAGAALLVGLAAWVTWHARTLWLESPSLIALFVAGATFYAVTGLGRDTTAGASTVVSRYVYVGVAILTPVIAKVLSSASGWPVARLAVLVLLAVTVIGNVGQAETWAKSRVAVTSSLKVQLEAVARLLASGTQDVSGPGASPIGLFPDLSAANIDRMQRLGQLPAAPLTRAELVNARALLAVGTWEGSKTGLSPAPLFGGRFRLVTAAHSATSLQVNGCYDFDPETVSPAMQVWLRLSAGERSASVRVSSSPAAPGITNHLAALLIPPEGPASTDAVQLAIPAGGTGYLSDNYPGADLVLLWDVGTPLELCGLSGETRH